jgi:hypothetical protein
MMSLVRVSIISAFLCVPCGATNVVHDATAEVPFSFEKGLVVVKARINKDLLVDVVIATGAQYSIADSELLNKYKVPLNSRGAAGPPIIITDLYSPINIREFISVPDVSVGPAKTSSLSMGVGSTVQLSKITGREIFAILGADFLKGRVVQVDFKNRVLRFLDHSPTELSGDKDEAAPPTRRIMLPMEESDDPLKLNLPSPVVVKAAFNGKTVKTLLNTGMVAVIALSSSAAKKLGFTVPTEKSSPGSDKIATLRLGTYELKDVPVVVGAKGTTIDQTLGQYGAAAGSLFLQNFIITFDFRSKVVILEHV